MGSPRTLDPPVTSSTAPLSSRERDELRRVRTTRIPVVVVVLSLALAILLPRLAEQRIERLRNEINDVADPARLRVVQIQLEIALEASQRRGYLLTGDEELQRQFEISRGRRREAEVGLLEYARQLDNPGSARLTQAALRIQDLDRGLDSLISKQGPVSPATLDDQRRRFLVIQTSADSLGATIDSAAAARRAEINRTESTIAILTAALVLLGLGAGFLVARLESRFRALALRLDQTGREREQLLESERAARAIAEQRQLELERVTESRARLMRGFTHDVKNPLGAADGYLSLLEEGVLGGVDDDQRVTVSRVRRSIRHALELISQLLEIARAEAGQLELRPRLTDVGEQVRDVADAFVAQAKSKQLALDVRLPPNLPPIETDSTRVRQVIGNLISNAVKYTPNGGHIAIAADKPSDQEILITVSDDGPGIPDDKLPMLFSEFTRLDPSAAEGAGIGLAISQRIAHALGGEITVESKVGVGSTFALRLPLEGK